MYKLAIIFLIVLSFLPSALCQSAAGWKKIENRHFSFSVPAYFKEVREQGIDSFVGKYVSRRIKLTFDYGAYSNDLSNWPQDAKFEHVPINGRSAKIGVVTREIEKGFPYSTAIYIQLDGGTALNMFAACKTEKDIKIAREIFETVLLNTPTKRT